MDCKYVNIISDIILLPFDSSYSYVGRLKDFIINFSFKEKCKRRRHYTFSEVIYIIIRHYSSVFILK